MLQGRPRDASGRLVRIYTPEERKARRKESWTNYNRSKGKPGSSRRYFAKNREKMLNHSVLWAKQNPLRVKFINYRHSARERGLPFSLDRDLFIDLITDNCCYCGAEPAAINGIDRVDNSRGYEEDNVVTCCKLCNLAKRSMTVSEFSAWCDRVGGRVHLWKGMS